MNKRTLFTACAFMVVSLVASGVARSQPAAPPEVVGTYLLTILEQGTKTLKHAVCEINGNELLLDDKPWGTWQAVSTTKIEITAKDQQNGLVKLSRLPAGNLLGQQKSQASNAKWTLERIYVVSKWNHQAGNGQPFELSLWSNGRAQKPDSRIQWKIVPAARELILQWPEATDRCKLSADGRRYEGRNEHGMLITGKLIE